MEKTGSTSGDFKDITRIIKRFLPVFVLAATLPFLIGFVVAPPDIGFFTRADDKAILRVWLEPANAVMSEGSSATLTVLASFEGDNELIPEINLYVEGSDNLSVSDGEITYSTPFSGRVEIGTVSVQAIESGKGNVAIKQGSISVTAYDGPLEIITGSSSLVVR